MKLLPAIALLLTTPLLVAAATPIPPDLPSSTAAPTPPAAAATFTTNTTLVLVPALVRTKSGALVYTLQADDFTLTDNGVEQKLSLEDDTDSQPLALVVAIQNGGASGRQLDKLANITPLIENMVGGVRHHIAVVSFDSNLQLVQDFTPRINDVAEAIHGLTPGDNGASILDALNFSVDLLRKQPREYRRAILIISETIDHGAKKGGSTISLQNALRAITDTNTTIFALGFSTPKEELKHGEGSSVQDSTPGPPGGCMAKDPNADPTAPQNKLAQAWGCLGLLAPPLRAAQVAAVAAMDGMRHNTLETVAHLTGGEFYKVESEKSITSDLLSLANHVPNRYVLSFQPQSPSPGPHSIVLRLKNYSNLLVTARTNYWVDENPDAPIVIPHPDN
jgi:VWFA-related protein